MARNLLFFADGTWQGADSPNHSNVIKLFGMLAGANTLGVASSSEQERSSAGIAGKNDQHAKYIDGLGADGNWLKKTIQGAIGAGLIGDVLRGYTYLSRMYQPGDALYLVGFSRGSYTVRTLAGLIMAKGLLRGLDPAATDESGYRQAAKAWSDYMTAREARRSPDGLFADAIGRVQAAVADIPEIFNGLGQEPLYITPVPVVAIGVFDTVGALGIPVLAEKANVRIDVLQFADTVLNPLVAQAFHAVAIDEQRVDFTPTLWTARDGIEQVLHPGAHADVGGGYPLGPDSLLSDASLAWMAARLDAAGVAFQGPLPTASAGAPLGPQHEPWRGGVWTVRPARPREFPHQTSAAALTVSPVTLARLGHQAPVNAATDPPQNRTEIYDPPALRNAGYADVR